MINILFSSALIASSCTNQFRHISYYFILTLISVADGFGKNEQNLILINYYIILKSHDKSLKNVQSKQLNDFGKKHFIFLKTESLDNAMLEI